MQQPPSILVVDDERTGFTVIQSLLKPEGYALSYASGGQAAIEHLEAIAPDVILLDVMMPELDGIEVCHILKGNPIWAHIPIIMVTALNSREDLARCLNAGADDFIAKPVNRVELTARVRSMLRIKHHHDALKATLQLREDMSAMVVHDLRNPLTSILLGTQFVLTYSHLNPQFQDRLKLVYTAGQRLNSMINELLLIAKMEAGQLCLNLSQVDFNSLALNVLAGFQEIAETRNLELHADLPEPGYTVTADATLLHRLLDNLLSNAIKFSPEGRKVTLQASPATPPLSPLDGEAIVIRVVDEGPGIDADVQQKMFDKYQIGKPVENVSQTGLGLSFCKLVAEAHGGYIHYEDNAPRGSVFVVVI